MTKPRFKAVMIGASAGGVEALMTILPQLPAGFHLPICVVLHVPPDKESLLPSIFAVRCALPTHEAEDKLPIEPGHIYFAPPNYHLMIENGGTCALSGEDPVFFSRPSIDALFESGADACGAEAIGILLTGGNEDGARGLKAIAAAGGKTIVQDPAEAAVPTMPRAGLAACPSAMVAALADIPNILIRAGAGT